MSARAPHITSFAGLLAAMDKSGKLSPRQRKQLAGISAAYRTHPRLACMMQQAVLHRYERAHGKIIGAIDWSAIWEWVLAHPDVILKLLLAIVTLFLA